MSQSKSTDGSDLSDATVAKIREGHVYDSLPVEGNLYCFSQQGWEAINKKIRKIFFNQTAIGGGARGKILNGVR